MENGDLKIHSKHSFKNNIRSRIRNKSKQIKKNKSI